MRSVALFAALVLLAANADCSTENRAEKNVEILDIVWNTMNAEYFDPTFSGLDWKQEYREFRPIIEACETDKDLYYQLNKMLFKLGVSHLGVASPEEVNEISDPQLLLDGAAGLDVKYLNNAAVITKVFPGSSAGESKLRPGYEITKLNQKTVREIADRRISEPTPPFNDRNLAMMITSDLRRELYGTPGDTVGLEYLDEQGAGHAIRLPLLERHQRKAFILPNMPKLYASVDSRIINGNIGYVHFDVFHPAILDTVLQLIVDLGDLPNMIIDIRGNPGGEFGTRKRIAEQFVDRRTLFWKYQARGRIDEVYLDPAGDPYLGRLVILVDEMSSSSSEEFSGGMKAIGRATIVGRRTAGKVLTMKVVSLPEGALFVYPNKKTMTSRNEFLEGIGVIPDIEVELDAEKLLRGEDSQLDAAIEYLRKQGKI